MPKTRDRDMLEALGRRVSQLRRDRGWTQARLAASIGVETVSLSRLETGDRGLSLSMLSKIADVLEVSLGDLVDAARPVPQPQHDAALTQLVLVGEQLSPAGREALLRMAMELVKLLEQTPPSSN